MAVTSASPPPHPTNGLDDTIHQRVRLGLLSVLAESHQSDFGYLRTTLQLTDGNLGRHLDVLARDGLVEITKGYEGRRPRTWVTITQRGRAALAAEMQSLRDLLARYERSAGAPAGGPTA